MPDKVKYFETIIPTKKELVSFTPKVAEYYAAPDEDGLILYTLDRIRKLRTTEFMVGLKLTYWRLFTEIGCKYRLTGEYKTRVVTETGTLFNEGINAECVTAFMTIIKMMLTEMIDLCATQNTAQIFEVPSDAELYRIGSDLARQAEQQ